MKQKALDFAFKHAEIILVIIFIAMIIIFFNLPLPKGPFQFFPLAY